VPLIVGDRVYVQDGSCSIHAIERESGDIVWTSEGTGFSIGPFGVAIANGRIFGVHGSNGVRAVDAETGTEQWTREITATPTAGVDIQPVVFDDVVFASTVPISVGGIYTGGDRGILHALDAATGDDRWTFDTVDSDALWGNPEVNSGGGAWYPPAIDPERGVVYWGVANPAPFPGTPEFPNGTSRPGDNLYTNSVVTLDLAGGELQWYHQVTPHDLWDRDQVHTLIARDEDGDDTVISAGKGGVVVGLDPESGEQRWQTSVGVHKNDDLTEIDGPTEIAPGTYGGVLTPPATADNVVYLATVDSPVTFEPDKTAYFGAEMGVNDGELTAVDASTGDVLWEVDVPGDPLGGATVVNDLVFTASLQGTIVAIDRESGEIVWEEEAAGGINGWMAVADDMLVVPVGNADPPRVVAYRLPGGE
jgi:outer membrane protein assembly factor BamB